MGPLTLADRLLDALVRAGLVPGAFDRENVMRAVLQRELESVQAEEKQEREDRAFKKRYEVVTDDGDQQFMVQDRQTGETVAAGWCSRPELLEEWPF